MSTSESHERRILLVGGGTGGHFYPLIAVAEKLNAHEPRPHLYYAGPEEYDPEALRANNITFMRIMSGKRRRYASFLNVLDGFRVALGVLTALAKLFVLYPDVIVSKGGYTSVPVIIAAAFLRIPIIVHESDSVMGAANKLGSKFARHLIVTYTDMKLPKTKANVFGFGIPVRASLLSAPSSTAIQNLGIDPERPVILVLGGSQGAERINALILDSLNELLGTYTIIHQTGKKNIDLCTAAANELIPDPEVRKHYHPVAFLDGPALNDAYHLALVVVSRSGSTSIYEIALHGKPSILIPIPEEVSHDQRSNAYSYARSGAAIVMEERNLSDDLLRAEIDRMMLDDSVYQSMSSAAKSFGKPDAAERMALLIAQTAEEH